MSQTSEMHVLKSAQGRLQWRGKNGHNSLNWNAFWANEDLLERRFRAPCIGSIGWRNSQSGQRGKSVKRKVATKDNKEGGDHDVRDDWASFPLSVIDHVQHGKWNKSCMKHLHLLHEGPWLRISLKVRKSSSMTLNEALCGRQPDLLFYIYINMTVYIALFNRNIK